MVVNRKSWHYKVWRTMQPDGDAAKPVSSCRYIAELALSPLFFTVVTILAATLGPMVFIQDKLESWWKSRFPSGVCPHGEITFE